jgi:putative heme transporter
VFAAVLIYRLFAFWLPVLPGAVAFLQLRRTVARWEAERASAAPEPAAAGP